MSLNKIFQPIFSKIYLRVILQKFYGKDVIVLGHGSLLLSSSKVRVYDKKNGAITIGQHSIIRGEIVILGHGGRCEIGDYCYIGDGTRLWSAASIVIGNRVLISHNVNIFDSQTHPISARKRHEEFGTILSSGFPKHNDLNEKPVRVEDDVLVGASSIILRGVRIGQGAIIAAGAVVTKDVPPWTIVAGNPARVIREIPEDER